MIPWWLRYRLYFWGQSYFECRKPDEEIGRDGERPFLFRWKVLPRNRWFNVYWHRWLHSDDDRALHDHPWFSCSLILDGRYIEVTTEERSPLRVNDIRAAVGRHWRSRFWTPGYRVFNEGSVIFRAPWSKHRIELMSPDDVVTTLFIVGPRLRPWGFFCPKGWVSSAEFHAHGGCP
jgi:hypothetical protein